MLAQQQQQQKHSQSVSRFRKLLRRVVLKKNRKPVAAGDQHAVSEIDTPALPIPPTLAEDANAADESNKISDDRENDEEVFVDAVEDVIAEDDDVDVLVDLNSTDEDRLLAQFVQDKECKEHAENQMMVTKQGKAWKFVQAVLDLHALLKMPDAADGAEPQISTVAIDEMVWFVERMLVKQEEFSSMGVCTVVDLGYHYTKPDNLDRIRTDGLLSNQERIERNIKTKHNGSSYGDGIYTCDDPNTYRNQSYGPVCLLVARLKGATASVVSNATFAVGSLVVLRSSAQCVPMIQFTLEPDELIRKYHEKLQSLVDQYFNAEAIKETVILPRNKTLQYIAPQELNKGALAKVISLPAKKACATDDCAICLNALQSQRLGQIEGCGHQFHYQCIVEAISHSSRCPLCTRNLVKPQGTMPSGTMTITILSKTSCGGHAPGTIQIDYRIESGIQKSYHSNPGVSFDGTSRTAYLPDNIDGQLLLKRLEYAFQHGLSFTVGTSLTSGKQNCVTWASIHHKTNLSGGAFGFPDLSYFYNCNEELDALGVPAALSL